MAGQLTIHAVVPGVPGTYLAVPEADVSARAIESFSPEEMFAPGVIDLMLSQIQEEVRAHPSDASTKKGREAITRLAYKVSRSKTAIEDARKTLVAGEKKRLALIDCEGKKARDVLDALRDEVRRPLDEFESAEAQRIAAHEVALAQVEQLMACPDDASYENVKARLVTLAGLRDRDWQEFAKRAAQMIERAEDTVGPELACAELRERDAAEEAARRQQQAMVEQEEREKAMALRANEAAAKAVKDAEARAEEAEKRLAEQQARAEEQRRIEAARVLARAEAERAAAVEAERARVAEQARVLAQAQAEREANSKHRTAINRQAIRTLEEEGVDRETAFLVISRIAQGRIPNVRIVY